MANILVPNLRSPALPVPQPLPRNPPPSLLLPPKLPPLPELASADHQEWTAIFGEVLFPLITRLLRPEIYQIDPIGMSDTRVQAANLLCKIFLHYLVLLSEWEGMLDLWLRILDIMDRLMNSGQGDNLEEAVPESLKNILLVMADGVSFNRLWMGSQGQSCGMRRVKGWIDFCRTLLGRSFLMRTRRHQRQRRKRSLQRLRNRRVESKKGIRRRKMLLHLLRRNHKMSIELSCHADISCCEVLECWLL